MKPTTGTLQVQGPMSWARNKFQLPRICVGTRIPCAQQTPNKPNNQVPATTPAHEMNAANVDLGNLMRQRRSRKPDAPTSRSRKPDAAPSAQMQLRRGSDAGHMRLRCRSYAAQMQVICGSDAAQMRLRCGSDVALPAQQCWWHRQRARPFSKKWEVSRPLAKSGRCRRIFRKKAKLFCERSVAHTRCSACLFIWCWMWRAAIKHIRFATCNQAVVSEQI